MSLFVGDLKSRLIDGNCFCFELCGILVGDREMVMMINKPLMVLSNLGILMRNGTAGRGVLEKL